MAELIPVYKIGLILLRGLRDGIPHICITRVKAKNPDEQHLVDFGLPKGTRRYFDGTGWVDARDDATVIARRDTLEPLFDTLTQEAESEAGVPPQAMKDAPIYELGARLFGSRKGSAVAIQWYVIEASDALVATMHPHPADAAEVAWATLPAMEAMVKAGRMNEDYAALAREAVEAMQRRVLPLLV